MKNIIAFPKNILTRQNSASVEYNVYIQNFIETPSDTLPLVYWTFEFWWSDNEHTYYHCF